MTHLRTDEGGVERIMASEGHRRRVVRRRLRPNPFHRLKRVQLGDERDGDMLGLGFVIGVVFTVLIVWVRSL